MAEKTKLIFMGTPEFAATILEILMDAEKFSLEAVFTQPDRKSGRNQKIEFQAVKKLAQAHGLPIYQPQTLRDADSVAIIEKIKPDFLVVAAYGLLLPQSVLAIPTIAPINVHASLLPAYRGAAPIQRAIMENWQPGAETGVSIMKIKQKLDAGPVYAEAKVPIQSHTAGELQKILAVKGAELLLKVLVDIKSKGLEPVPQDDAYASYAPKLSKGDGIIDWTQCAYAVDARIRAVIPWPGAQAALQITERAEPIMLSLLPGKVVEPQADLQAGRLFRLKNRLFAACGADWYELGNLRPQGKKEVTPGQFINGHLKNLSGECGHFLSLQ